jgi:hypothetical protein
MEMSYKLIHLGIQDAERQMVKCMPILYKVTFTIPMTKNLLASEANLSREHWTIKKKRHDAQQFLIDSYMNHKVFTLHTTCSINTIEPEEWLPCRITLARIAPRSLDEDNLLYSLKWVRDAISDNLIPGLAKGRADGDKRLEFKYNQEKGRPREYALKIEIEKLN